MMEWNSAVREIRRGDMMKQYVIVVLACLMICGVAGDSFAKGKEKKAAAAAPADPAAMQSAEPRSSSNPAVIRTVPPPMLSGFSPHCAVAHRRAHLPSCDFIKAR